MLIRPFATTVALLLSLLSGVTADAEPTTLFDPHRHMRVDEVRPGMRGYGLSVFRGTKIERFDVEVVSVLRHYNPRRHVVLIRCTGQNLEHTGAVQGMSGSPIFLRDDVGRDRMIGAFAYGWALAKDPVAGVQPIEYMLELPEAPVPTTQPSATGDGRFDALAWVRDYQSRHGLPPPAAPPVPGAIVPLTTPLCAAGLPPVALDRFADHFSRLGLHLVRGAAGGGNAEMDAPIAPGAVVVAPLLVGDAEIHANGTCTEVIGDRVFAFGHPFNNEGQIALPMAGGGVHTVIASLQSSFKIASMGTVRGELHSDETVGVAGRFGAPPAMIPIRVRVHRPDALEPVEYNFQAVRHPRFIPILSALAMLAALTGDSNLPVHNTVKFDIDLQFEDDRRVRLHNVDANADPAGLLFSVIAPVAAAAENPFAGVLPARIDAEFRVSAESSHAQILWAQLPRTRFRPGERVEAFVAYRPFRGPEATFPIAIELPRDLPEGAYQLSIGDWMTHLTEESAARPFRFSAENIEQVFDILQEISSVRRDAVYVRLLRQPDGVAVGRVAMQLLPSSRRQVLLDSGRSNVTAFVSSSVSVIPTRHVMSGSAAFTIHVDRKARTEPATRPAGTPAARPQSP